MTAYAINAENLHYTPLNQMIRKAVRDGYDEIIIDNVMGQRFIADGLTGSVKLTIHGVPGGDLGMFMSGPTCIVHGNAEHAPGNTMDGGCIVVFGTCGDATAHSMRGGKIFVRDDIGYRGGIHMKEYQEKRPALIIGHQARAFLGEYMAGGLLILLRRGENDIYAERGIGSGIHGGMILIRGEVDDWCLGVGAKKTTAQREEMDIITPYVHEFCSWFDEDPDTYLSSSFSCIKPASARPFVNKYTWE